MVILFFNPEEMRHYLLLFMTRQVISVTRRENIALSLSLWWCRWDVGNSKEIHRIAPATSY